MKVKELIDLLFTLDAETEIFAVPEIPATYVGEGRSKIVPLPGVRHPISGVCRGNDLIPTTAGTKPTGAPYSLLAYRDFTVFDDHLMDDVLEL